jgi:class 3 adenylate cyclase/tetratricopeptide (TPR) repeat protein
MARDTQTVLPSIDHGALAAYLAGDRYASLCQQRTLPEYEKGAALFADLSGFTRLTETLTQELGPRQGVEILTQHLNNVYTALIKQVQDYGGNVTGFSGDAITCWFEGAEEASTRRAVTAALEMQTAIKAQTSLVTPKGTSLELALKVAVAAGPARRLVVGDPARQLLDVLAGQTLERLAAAEKAARKGEIVVAPEVLEVLQSDLEVMEVRGEGGFAVISGIKRPAKPLNVAQHRSNLPLEQLRPWLLPEVYQRYEAGLGDFLTELRPAVALFLGFGELDYDHDPLAGAKLDVFVRRVQEVLTHYGGNLLQLTMGEKGSFLYAAFGAPSAHEDDAERAASAALKLSKLPEQPGLGWLKRIQLGISQGTMRVGEYGSPTRHTYGVLGDEVNLAARLMELAGPGNILVSGRVHSGLGQLFSWEKMTPVWVKGKAEPVSSYRLTGVAEATARQAEPLSPAMPMVGRATERRAMEQTLQTLLQGQSGVVIVEGEAGIGKSRLVGQLLEQSKKCSSLVCFEGNGDAMVQSSPYYSWRAVFCRLFGLNPEELNLEVCRQQVILHLTQLGQPQLLHLAPLLAAVLPFDWPDNELTFQMSGQVRADNTNRLLVELLKKVASTNPLLLVLEDAHWLDSASWALLQLVSREVQPVLVVVVTRPLTEPLPPEYIQLRQLPITRYLKLEVLPEHEALALVCQKLGVKRLPPAAARLIQEKAAGHPFFSEELAYALREAGLLLVEEGECRLSPEAGDLQAISFPDTIQGIITSRIDRLNPAQQLTLKVASVIGRVFAFGLLREVYPLDANREQLAEYIDGLERLDITVLETPAPDLAYFFKHVITQEVVYNLMLFSQRRQLHRAIAEWYEQAYRADLSAHYALLAYHWGKAQDFARTIEYLEKAGEQAARNFANREAIEFFSEALRLAESNDSGVERVRRARWERLLGEAYIELGDAPQSQLHFEKALELLGYPVPKGDLQIALKFGKELFSQIFSKLVKPGKLKAQERAVSLEAARALTRLGEIYYYAQRRLVGVYTAIAGLNLAEQAGPSPELARLYSNMTIATGGTGWTRLGEKFRAGALRVARNENDLSALIWVLLGTGLYDTWMCHWDRATESVQQLIDISDNLGDLRHWEDGLSAMAVIYGMQGRFRDSARLARTMQESANRRGDRQNEVGGWLRLVENCLPLDRAAEALYCLEQAGPLLSGNTDRASEIRYYGLRALTYQRLGQTAAAKEAAETAANLILHTPPVSFYTIGGLAGTLETCFSLWEQSGEDFRKQTRQLCAAFVTHAKAFPISWPYAWYYQGRLAWAEGQPDKAYKAWDKALVWAQKLGLPYQEGLVRFALGQCLPLEHPEREMHLGEAYRIFRRLNASYNLRQFEGGYAASSSAILVTSSSRE